MHGRCDWFDNFEFGNKPSCCCCCCCCETHSNRVGSAIGRLTSVTRGIIWLCTFAVSSVFGRSFGLGVLTFHVWSRSHIAKTREVGRKGTTNQVQMFSTSEDLLVCKSCQIIFKRFETTVWTFIRKGDSFLLQYPHLCLWCQGTEEIRRFYVRPAWHCACLCSLSILYHYISHIISGFPSCCMWQL